MPQGVQPETFLWAITHFEWYYNSIFQFGVAANIGVFFLLIKKDSLIYFNRGWLLGTILMTIWAILLADKKGFIDLFQSWVVIRYHFNDNLGGDD